MDTKILDDIRSLMGSGTDSIFDTDLLIHINSFLADLTQVGVGPAQGMVADENTTWHQFTGNEKLLPAIRTYVYIKTRLIFDPPQSGFVTTSMQESAKELLWRINIDAES